MTAIDFIEVGKPMPKYVPDFRALNDTGYHNLIKSLEARVKPEYGFSYVPYLPWNINEFDITMQPREIISSQFTGCLMVAWEDSRGIFAAHVAIDDYNCIPQWVDIRNNHAKRSYAFRPSDYIPAPTDMGNFSIYGFLEFDINFRTLTAFSVLKDVDGIVQVKKMVYEGTFEGHKGLIVK